MVSPATFKKVPLWLFYPADDATVEVQYSRALAEALKRDKESQYTEYPTGGHGVPGKVFEEEKLHEWLETGRHRSLQQEPR